MLDMHALTNLILVTRLVSHVEPGKSQHRVDVINLSFLGWRFLALGTSGILLILFTKVFFYSRW